MPGPEKWIRFELGLFGADGFRHVIWSEVPRVGDLVQLVDQEKPREVLQVVWVEEQEPGGSQTILGHVLVRIR